jgi:hypothetical protein
MADHDYWHAPFEQMPEQLSKEQLVSAQTIQHGSSQIDGGGRLLEFAEVALDVNQIDQRCGTKWVEPAGVGDPSGLAQRVLGRFQIEQAPLDPAEFVGGFRLNGLGPRLLSALVAG